MRLKLLDTFLSAASEAGSCIMGHYRNLEAIERKADNSPVTIADQESEKIIKAKLLAACPDIPMLCEESADEFSPDAVVDGRFILVDPIDGTKEFINGRTDFTVNIALIEDSVPTMGVVYCPALATIYWGDGATAHVGKLEPGAPISTVRDQARLTCCTRDAATGVAVASRSHRDAETDAFLAEHGITETLSRGSSLKFCILAEGKADIYPRFGPTMEWDTAAGDAVLRSAGGKMACPEGNPFVYGKRDKAFRNGAFIARAH